MALELPQDKPSQHTDHSNQQEFNHVVSYLDKIRVRANSSRVHITTKAISMTVFKWEQSE